MGAMYSLTPKRQGWRHEDLMLWPTGLMSLWAYDQYDRPFHDFGSQKFMFAINRVENENCLVMKIIHLPCPGATGVL
jgi:hypothetical protein